MSTKHSMLELLFLAVRWCSLPLPLSAVEGNIVSAYYYGAAVPLATIRWYSNWYGSKNSRTGYLQPLASGGAATFSAIIGKTIGCLNWVLDNVKRSCGSGGTAGPIQVPGNTPCRSGTGPIAGLSCGCSFSNVI